MTFKRLMGESTIIGLLFSGFGAIPVILIFGVGRLSLLLVLGTFALTTLLAAIAIPFARVIVRLFPMDLGGAQNTLDCVFAVGTAVVFITLHFRQLYSQCDEVSYEPSQFMFVWTVG